MGFADRPGSFVHGRLSEMKCVSGLLGIYRSTLNKISIVASSENEVFSDSWP